MPKKKVEPKKNTKRNPALSLSLPERFYIENNGNLSVEQIADNIGKPVELVKSYTEEWLKKNPLPKETPRARKLMARPGKNKGVVVMTQEASMVGDEAYNKYVTLEAINRAMSDGKHELAKELKERYDEQLNKNKMLIRNRWSENIHYIESPDDNEEVF